MRSDRPDVLVLDLAAKEIAIIGELQGHSMAINSFCALRDDKVFSMRPETAILDLVPRDRDSR